MIKKTTKFILKQNRAIILIKWESEVSLYKFCMGFLSAICISLYHFMLFWNVMQYFYEAFDFLCSLLDTISFEDLNNLQIDFLKTS